MDKSPPRRVTGSNRNIVGGRWLPNLFIWIGVLLMLTGGVLAYPTLQSNLVPPDAQSLEFSVTLAPEPSVAAVAVKPTELTATPVQNSVATATAPPPVVLPETELIVVEDTPTAQTVQLDETVTPSATPEPTPTPSPTPTPDPASLIPNRLAIPAIDLDSPVVEVGWDTEEINGALVSSWIVPDTFASGWHVTSALPGHPGNTVLNGHHNINGEVFRDLEDLQPGDEVIVYTGQTTFYYSVTERHILEEKNQTPEVREQNAQFIMPTEDERLTMVTCWPYTNNTHRLVIVAMPMEPTPAPTLIVQ